MNEAATELETRIVQTKVNTVAGVSEPNFEDDISIDVEDDAEQEPQTEMAVAEKLLQEVEAELMTAQKHN